MTLTIHRDLVQGTDEWLNLRRGMVTASVVGKLLTPTGRVAANDDSRNLVAMVVAERITGASDPVYISDDMMRGTLHEPLARDAYSQANGVTVDQVGFMIRAGDGWTLGASPDGLVGDDGGIEIKCPRAKVHIRTIVADEMPAHHMAQIQTSLLVSGREWWDFVSFCAGLPLWTKRIYPDPKWHAATIEAVTRFEKDAAAMAAAYEQATKGLPQTERISDDIDVIA